MRDMTITINMALLTLLVAQFLAKPLIDLAQLLCKRWFTREIVISGCVVCFSVFYSVLLIAVANWAKIV